MKTKILFSIEEIQLTVLFNLSVYSSSISSVGRALEYNAAVPGSIAGVANLKIKLSYQFTQL